MTLEHQIDRDLAQRSLSASFLPFFLFLTTGLFTPYFEDHPVSATVFALIFGVVGVTRRAWALAQERQPALGWRWRPVFFSGAIAAATCWSAFATWTVFLYGGKWTTWFVLLLTAGISAGATVSLSPSLTALDAYVLVMLFPVGISCALQGTTEGRAFAVAILLYLFFLTRLGQDLSRQYWRAASDRVLVQEQAVELRSRAEYLHALMQHSPLAIVALDDDDRIELCNPAFERMFQHPAAEALGKNLDELIAAEESEEAAAELSRRVRRGEAVHVTARRHRRDGSDVHVAIHGVPLRLGDGKTGQYALYEDITARVRMDAELAAAREELREQALRDVLTGVWNRRGILDLLEKELARVQRKDYPLTVFLMDLDHFKKVNDTYGHRAGDEVLAQAAQRLGAALRASDSLGRYGGEEFLVLAPDCDAEGAPHIAARLCHAISAYPVPTSCGLVPMTVSVGVAFARKPIAAADLLHHADCALYRAKASGRNRFEMASRVEETQSR